jgi:hypothetical protein
VAARSLVIMTRIFFAPLRTSEVDSDSTAADGADSVTVT